MSHDLERQALLAGIHGPVSQLAALADEFDPDLFQVAGCRAIAEALLAALPVALAVPTSSDPMRDPQGVALMRELHRLGVPDRALFPELHRLGVAFSLHGLAFYLGRLREDAERRVLRQQLVNLADTLERPGGPERVAQRLAVVR